MINDIKLKLKQLSIEHKERSLLKRMSRNVATLEDINCRLEELAIRENQLLVKKISLSDKDLSDEED